MSGAIFLRCGLETKWRCLSHTKILKMQPGQKKKKIRTWLIMFFQITGKCSWCQINKLEVMRSEGFPEMPWARREVLWKLWSHSYPRISNKRTDFSFPEPNLTQMAEIGHRGVPFYRVLRMRTRFSMHTFHTIRTLIIKIVKLKGSCRQAAGFLLPSWLRHKVSRSLRESHLPC